MKLLEKLGEQIPQLKTRVKKGNDDTGNQGGGGKKDNKKKGKKGR